MVGTVAGVGVAAYADGDSQPTTSGDTSTTQTQTTETPATDGASGNKTGESGESEADTKSDSTGADADTAQSGDAVAKQAAPAPASVDAVAARKALPSILGNVPSTNGSIKVNLFDYNTNGRDGNINYASGSNRIMRPFTFGPTDSVAGRSLNAWTGNNGGLYQGIVSSDLTGDGYPQLASGSTSLGYLFGGEYNVNGLAESHADVDGLFQEKNGYYTYDSAKNYAQYDSTDNKFDLYDGGRFYNGGLPNDAGAFMPFNSLSTNTHNYNGTDGYGLNKDNNYYFGIHDVHDAEGWQSQQRRHGLRVRGR